VPDVIVVGGGLAGSESAWQVAEYGLHVQLFEMRPKIMTGAHTGPNLAELVCSNSLGSNIPTRASGLVKEELRILGSLVLACAEETFVPAGGALAVDREAFAQKVTDEIENHPRIEVIRQEVVDIPQPTATVIASGPLTSKKLSDSLKGITGSEHLYFFDAISPIIEYDSIDLDIAFKASRYDRGKHEIGDYINCPFSQEEYNNFVSAIIDAERIPIKKFENAVNQGVKSGIDKYFESCMPIEILANRGVNTLAYGPMRPVGLINPKTGKRPYAVVQLRQDNLTASLYNVVGFQNNLKFGEQERVFRMIPGLENAEFVRFGQMHRNTFIYSPKHLNQSLQFKKQKNLFFAGQITGVEGYISNIATGLLAGLNAARYQMGMELLVMPVTTMLGALCYYITHASPSDFQPMKPNFGIMPSIGDNAKRSKRERAEAYKTRSLIDIESCWAKFKNDSSYAVK
jgi:methylenetetrahydrofolate--tRNA-(uracil-5-)-methyltransferase